VVKGVAFSMVDFMAADWEEGLRAVAGAVVDLGADLVVVGTLAAVVALVAKQAFRKSYLKQLTSIDCFYFLCTFIRSRFNDYQ
jgi:hypothetical protein